jgi:hypothetical protein
MPLADAINDAKFSSLSIENQRSLAQQYEPSLGQLDGFGQDRILTRLAKDPFTFTEQRHGLAPGSLKDVWPLDITPEARQQYGLPDDQIDIEPSRIATAGWVLADQVKQAAQASGGAGGPDFDRTLPLQTTQNDPTTTPTTQDGNRVATTTGYDPALLAQQVEADRVENERVKTGLKQLGRGAAVMTGGTLMAPLGVTAALAGAAGAGGVSNVGLGLGGFGEGVVEGLKQEGFGQALGLPIRALLGIGRGIQAARAARVLRAEAKVPNAIPTAIDKATNEATAEAGRRVAATTTLAKPGGTIDRALPTSVRRTLRSRATPDPTIHISPTGGVTRLRQPSQPPPPGTLAGTTGAPTTITPVSAQPVASPATPTLGTIGMPTTASSTRGLRPPTRQRGPRFSPAPSGVPASAIPTEASRLSNTALKETETLINVQKKINKVLATDDIPAALSTLGTIERRLGTTLPSAGRARLYQSILTHQEGKGLKSALLRNVEIGALRGFTFSGGKVGIAIASGALGGLSTLIRRATHYIRKDPAFALSMGQALSLPTKIERTARVVALLQPVMAQQEEQRPSPLTAPRTH